MQDTIFGTVRAYIVAPSQCDLADLRTMQRECSPVFPPQRCPYCHARLFDGWLFGRVKCWRCQELFVGYIDEFVRALRNPHDVHTHTPLTNT